MIAPVAVGEGNTTVKLPAVLDLSAPKSKLHTALLEAELLYMRAPRTPLRVAVPKVRSVKSHTAVELARTGVTLVRALPPLV